MLSAAALAASTVPDNFSAASPLLASPGSAQAVDVFSSEALDQANFRNITLTTAPASSTTVASITEDAGSNLVVQPGGSIDLTGGVVSINGWLTARAGAISITTRSVTIGPTGATLFNDNVADDIVIGSGAVLNVSGLFVNDTLLPPDEQGQSVLDNAGSISLKLIRGRPPIPPQAMRSSAATASRST